MISFRDANANDADAIARLVNTAFLVERFFIERDRTKAEAVCGLMKKGKFLLAEEGSRLIACIYMEHRGERGYFGMLSVDPSRQQKGLGSELVAAAEAYFREAGCKFCDLKIVNVRTELQTLYRRLGYVETGTSVYDDPVPTKVPVHFIAMSKPLR